MAEVIVKVPRFLRRTITCSFFSRARPYSNKFARKNQWANGIRRGACLLAGQKLERQTIRERHTKLTGGKSPLYPQMLIVKLING
jgi:hypothetical protein